MLDININICPELMLTTFINQVNLDTETKNKLKNDYDLRNVIIDTISDIIRATADKEYCKKELLDNIQQLVNERILLILPSIT